MVSNLMECLPPCLRSQTHFSGEWIRSSCPWRSFDLSSYHFPSQNKYHPSRILCIGGHECEVYGRCCWFDLLWWIRRPYGTENKITIVQGRFNVLEATSPSSQVPGSREHLYTISDRIFDDLALQWEVPARAKSRLASANFPPKRRDDPRLRFLNNWIHIRPAHIFTLRSDRKWPLP